MPSIGVTRWHPFNFAYIGLSSNRVSIKYWVIVEPGFNQILGYRRTGFQSNQCNGITRKMVALFLQRISL